MFGVAHLPSSEAKHMIDLISSHNKQTNYATTDIIYKINNNGLWLEDFPLKSKQWKVAQYGNGVDLLDVILPGNESMNSWSAIGRSRQKRVALGKDWSPSASRDLKSKVIPFDFVLVDTENENSENVSPQSDDECGLFEINPTEASIEFFDDVSILTQDNTFGYEEEKEWEFDKKSNVLLAVEDAALTEYLISLV